MAGAVKDCCMVLGTNAMVEFKMQTVHANSSVVKPSDVDTTGHTAPSPMRSVFLVRAVHMAPRQSKVVEVSAAPMDSGEDDIGVVTPSETVAYVLCDFQEILWAGITRFWITLNNWGNESVTLTKGQQVGSVEPAVVISENDPVWAELSTAVLMCQASSETKRNKQLKEELQIGVQLTSQERDQCYWLSLMSLLFLMKS